jgi:HAD superfamily hydrolase (TIGR01490 family)
LNLCLFDLDDTLLPLDSDKAWCDFVVALGWVDGPAFQQQSEAFYAQYKAKCLDVHAYIAFVTEPLRARSSDELQAAHARFMAEVINPQVRPAALDLVRLHQEQGDDVALVTATNDFVTGPIAKALGVDHLLAVRLERASDGSLTGRIEGVPTYREGKVTRVGQWLAARGRHWAEFERVTVYSDSANDLPLLEKATHPVATNPTPELEAIALARGWKTLKLFA